MNIGERIYNLRTKADMSQGDLAEKLNVSRQSVSKWENNNSTPDIEKLVLLASVFGITVDELVKDTTTEASKASPDEKHPYPDNQKTNIQQSDEAKDTAPAKPQKNIKAAKTLYILKILGNGCPFKAIHLIYHIYCRYNYWICTNCPATLSKSKT